MNPLYLGSRERRLFGIYDAPATAARTRAAVLCHPWGAEYVYAHRSMRQLALRLAGAGFHTLRFDYFGTGDSDGDSQEADLSGWENDVLTAVEALRDMAGTARVTLVGLRLGASLAARAAASLGKDAEALVLWDPVVSGEEYVSSLAALENGSDADGESEVLGFPLTPTFRADLRKIDLQGGAATPACRTLLIATEQLPSHARFTTLAAQTKSALIEVNHLTAPCPWVESVTLTGAVPVRVFQHIVKWLK